MNPFVDTWWDDCSVLNSQGHCPRALLSVQSWFPGACVALPFDPVMVQHNEEQSGYGMLLLLFIDGQALLLRCGHDHESIWPALLSAAWRALGAQSVAPA